MERSEKMPTPAKSAAVLAAEKRSHMTKKELEKRGEAEKSLMTGQPLTERPEVKENPIAHKEFLRIKRLLKKIGRDDAILEAVMNRYCLLQAECYDFEKKREMFARNLQKLMEDPDIEELEKYRLQAQMQKSIIDVDKQIQTKRRMLFDIERENGMTIAAALRSIPKAESRDENPLLKALSDDG